MQRDDQEHRTGGEPSGPSPARPPDASPVSGTPPPAASRWKKGQSGNPGGRPKGRGITAIIREVGEREHGGKTLMELVAERLYKDALSGKFPAAKEIIERLDGKVPDKHQIEGKSEQTVFVCPPPRVIGKREPPPALEDRTGGGGGG